METKEKIRLDLIVSKNEKVSRTIAQDMIQEGLVSVSGKTVTAPGSKFYEDTEITVQRPEDIFVSRAGNKLKGILDRYSICVENKVCLDVGASTGGFTQCLLKYGAKRVYAVDTGTDQLSPVLRQNHKVISMEQTNILDILAFPKQPEFAAIDVSFVSVKKIFSSVLRLTSENAEVVCLIKPQFEAGREHINKKGIVKNPKVHLNILKSYYDYFISVNMKIKGVMLSPVMGGDGNKEYLIYMTKEQSEKSLSKQEFAEEAEGAVR